MLKLLVYALFALRSLLSFAFFIVTGTIGFLASFWFLRKVQLFGALELFFAFSSAALPAHWVTLLSQIYGSVKVD